VIDPSKPVAIIEIYADVEGEYLGVRMIATATEKELRICNGSPGPVYRWFEEEIATSLLDLTTQAQDIRERQEEELDAG
jgi:hypothetical protein